MSVLNVCSTTELDNSREQFLSRRYRNTPVAEQQGQKNLLYRRFYHHHHQHSGSTSSDSYDNYSSYTSSSSSSFEVLFSRLLDALIFTSAIAITAYSYLTGTLVVPQAVVEAPKPNLVGYNHHQQLTKRHSHHSLLDSNATGGNSLIQAADSIEDSKRKRTQEWAEQQINTSTAATPAISTNHHHSQSSHHHHNHQHIHSNSSPINSSTTKKRSYSVLDKKVLY
jgi:hypothetical protein